MAFTASGGTSTGTTVPPPVATANVTLTPGTGLLKVSVTITEGGVATAAPATADCPFPAFTATVLAAAGFTVTVGFVFATTPPTVADTICAPVTVLLKVPVATPLALVWPTGCTSVFPLPVAASTTVDAGDRVPGGVLRGHRDGRCAAARSRP